MQLLNVDWESFTISFTAGNSNINHSEKHIQRTAAAAAIVNHSIPPIPMGVCASRTEREHSSCLHLNQLGASEIERERDDNAMCDEYWLCSAHVKWRDSPSVSSQSVSRHLGSSIFICSPRAATHTHTQTAGERAEELFAFNTHTNTTFYIYIYIYEEAAAILDGNGFALDISLLCCLYFRVFCVCKHSAPFWLLLLCDFPVFTPHWGASLARCTLREMPS